MRALLLLLFLMVAGRAEAQPAYLIFFAWDRASLTAEAGLTIHQAADTALHTHSSIEIAGFTDTSGTPGYNEGLSWRRAQTVAAELQRAGVPPNAISFRGFGENFLRQSTPDDVRDPQNRRVALILHPPVAMAPPPVVYAYRPIYPWPLYPWAFYPRPYWRGWYRW